MTTVETEKEEPVFPFAVFQLGKDGKFVAIPDSLFATASVLQRKLKEAAEISSDKKIPADVDVNQLNFYYCRAQNEQAAVDAAQQNGFAYREPRPRI